MYFYNIYDYEANIVLTHSKKFTQSEFVDMCDEAPKWQLFHDAPPYYDEDAIVSHLINKYGFKEIKYQAGLFTMAGR